MYIVTRYGLRELVYCCDHNGQMELTDEMEAVVGLNTTDFKEVGETTGVQITADTGFEFKGVSARTSGRGRSRAPVAGLGCGQPPRPSGREGCRVGSGDRI
ncbi:hypothetical protein AB0N28_03940 [Streptomyces sp. NPDC051130]|uniref:hypothetical protein n=1 Tax=Streptomyces sp. NPDC051130 TaxID=3157223 RepID=UPI00343E7AE6